MGKTTRREIVQVIVGAMIVVAVLGFIFNIGGGPAR